MPMKKTSRSKPRQVWKHETWKPYKVLVARTRKGRFISWARIRPKPRARRVPRREAPAIGYARERMKEPRGKSLAIYGTAEIRRRGRKYTQERRWELYKPAGMTGQEWQNAVGHAKRHPPNRPVKSIYADDIAGEYEGEWIDEPTIKS